MKRTFLVLLLVLSGTVASAAERPVKRLNILFFTADDMNFDSSGAYGGPIKDLTPHVDRLAAEGLRFQHAYSTVAVCQPVCQIMQTGLYPHRNGAVLNVLKEEGFADNTLVMLYGGDHGMSFPFAKSNDYENSSRGALIIRWSGVTKPGGVDTNHLVSTLDFAPTLLEAAGLPPIPGIDGRSFVPAVRGETMPGWDRVFTFCNAAFGNRWLPMRCVRTRDRAYIWNAWSDGKRQYQTENMAGLTWKAMPSAAATNPVIKARTDFYLYRVPEEF